jgi:DNA polymerase-3 subunit beta
MKFTIATKDLIKAVQKASNTVSKSDSNLLLRNYYLKAADNRLLIIATDLELSVVSECKAAVKEPGEVTVPGDQFYAIVTRADGDEFRFSLEGDVASIKVGFFEASLKCLPATDYPAVPVCPTEFKTVPVAKFVEALGNIGFAVCNNEARKNLCVVFINDGHMQAADGQAAATVAFKSDIENIAIPALALESLLAVLRTTDEKEAQLASNDNFLFFRLGQDLFITRTEHPKFPAVLEKYIRPLETNPFVLKVDKGHLTSVMGRVAATSEAERKSMKFQVKASGKGHELEASAQDGNGNSSKEPLACEWSGPEDYSFFMSYAYMNEVLQKFKDNTVTIKLAESIKVPVRFAEGDLIAGVMRLGA